MTRAARAGLPPSGAVTQFAPQSASWSWNRPGARRAFDTAALAASLPFPSPDLPPPDPVTAAAPAGVLYGLNAASPGVVCWDRWAQDNHNSVILGRSGGGKSYLAKLDILRFLYAGVQAAVIDPEDEYARLAEAAGGTLISPVAAGVHLNPLDLPAPPEGAAPCSCTPSWRCCSAARHVGNVRPCWTRRSWPAIRRPGYRRPADLGPARRCPFGAQFRTPTVEVA
jgi:hypothetical protein